MDLVPLGMQVHVCMRLEAAAEDEVILVEEAGADEPTQETEASSCTEVASFSTEGSQELPPWVTEVQFPELHHAGA